MPPPTLGRASPERDGWADSRCGQAGTFVLGPECRSPRGGPWHWLRLGGLRFPAATYISLFVFVCVCICVSHMLRMCARVSAQTHLSLCCTSAVKGHDAARHRHTQDSQPPRVMPAADPAHDRGLAAPAAPLSPENAPVGSIRGTASQRSLGSAPATQLQCALSLTLVRPPLSGRGVNGLSGRLAAGLLALGLRHHVIVQAAGWPGECGPIRERLQHAL
jgi:hypothetical protein